MFMPNQKGQFQRATGRNIDGEETYADPVNFALAVVRLAAAAEKTSVRSDSSASRGAADVMTADAKILTKTTLEVDDLVLFNGATMRVVGTHPRYTVAGQLDHYEVAMEHFAA